MPMHILNICTSSPNLKETVSKSLIIFATYMVRLIQHADQITISYAPVNWTRNAYFNDEFQHASLRVLKS